MIIKGDKIKLVKEIGNLVKVGDEFTVTGVDNGVITFTSEYGEGVMSYDEFEKHFESNPKHSWSQWLKIGSMFYNILSERNEIINIEYRHDSDRRVQIRMKVDPNDDKYIRSEANCHKEDDFNFNIGYQLARARLYVKWMDEKVKEYVETL